MRLSTTLAILSLLTGSVALADDPKFVDASPTVARPVIHGPFNASQVMIANVPVVKGRPVVPPVRIESKPVLARADEGDDLPTMLPGPVLGRPTPSGGPPLSEVGEGNVTVGPVTVLPSSWEVDSSSQLQALDLQIGVSNSRILMSSVHHIASFTKDGTVLSHMNLADFFGLVRDDMNDKVLDPSTGMKLVAPYKIDEFYDARIVFDAYRKRFWVGCLARNSKARGDDPNNTKHRVTKYALAVSKSENPADGFISYWWDACTDYPYMGVSEKLLTVSFKGQVMVALAGKLASGVATKPYHLTSFHHADQGVASSWLTAALHHGPSTGGAHFLLSTYGGNKLELWAIDQNDPAKMLVAEVPVTAYQGPVPADQKAHADIPHPHQVLMTNVKNYVMKAVYRDGRVYGIWHDARQWSGAASPVTSIRLVRLNVSEYPTKVAGSGKIDRTFGHRNAADPPNTIFSYYWPSLEVNRDGTMIVSYNRSGATIFPEIRYSVYRANGNDIESSQLFQAGQYPLGEEDANYAVRPDQKAVGRLDYTASAVDPKDDRTVWIFQPYAIKASTGKGGYRLKVGRIVIKP